MKHTTRTPTSKLVLCGVVSVVWLCDLFVFSQVARLRERTREEGAVKERIYAESRSLFEARQAETNLGAEIAGAQRVARNAVAKMSQLDNEAQRQKEIVYTADFQLQLMERKV